MINKSFQLVRTNPLLTTNVKLVVNSDYKLFLESFNTNLELNNVQYKHFPIYKNDLLETKLSSFWRRISREISYDVKYDNDNQIVQSDFSKQVDTIYMAGASYVEDQWHSEEFEYLAPMYIRKSYLPKAFIILRVDDPSSYGSESTNNSELNSVDKNNFYREIVDKWKCVKFFDMTYETTFGSWLYKNYLNNDRFPKAPFQYNPEKTEFSNWFGIDYNTGVYTQKPFFMEEQNEIETPHFRFEQFITEGYRRSGLIFPNILNVKFLFDDTPATPNSLKKYSMNRYYGFYAEDLDFVCSLTSYVTPEVKSNTILINNIVMTETGTTEESCVLEDFYNIYFSGDTKYISTNPFIEIWDDKKEYYIFIDNTHILDRKKTISGLYQVKRTFQNNRWLYKIISDEILDDYWNTSRINSKTVNIEYGNYNKIVPMISYTGSSENETFFIDKYKINHTTTSNSIMNIPTVSGETRSFTGGTDMLFKSGDIVNIIHDTDHSFEAEVLSYDSVNGIFEVYYISDNGGGETYYDTWTIVLVNGINKYMYGDLYLIKIDGKYHVIKHYEDDIIDDLVKDSNGNSIKQYYIQSDYAINLNNSYLEYWINGKNSEYYKKVNVNVSGQIPTTFPIYRVKFSDIKDFDFDRIDTGFSKFDYEKSTYVDTMEEKLYSFDYNYDSIPEPKRVGKYGTPQQGKVENVSSEYIADDSLFEIYSKGKQFSTTFEDGTLNDTYDLNTIWRKNQSICKWGYVGSISHSDYPYKLNNNYEVGGIYNRTIDPFLSLPDIKSKNMDYFYRLGNFYNSNGYVYYDNQSTNIQQEDFIEENIKRFDVKAYFDLNFDYFTFFFKNKEKYYDGNLIRNFDKYSTFNGGDDNVPSSTLFKVLKVKVREVTSIYNDSNTGLITSIKIGQKNYNDYKFSIIFNDNYQFNEIDENFSVLDTERILDTSKDCINIIMNEKFKNILIIINTSFQNPMIPLNNIDKYDEKTGLYNGLDRDGNKIPESEYNPSLFTASNFIRAINDFNTNYNLLVYYYCIREVDGKTYFGKTEILDTEKSTMTNIPNWSYPYTPFILEIEYPIEINLKNNCYWTDPYFIDSVENDYAATVITLDKSHSYNTKIYRYMGYYEPIFRDIELFEGGYFYYDLKVKTSILEKNISSKPKTTISDNKNTLIKISSSEICKVDDYVSCYIPEQTTMFYSKTIKFGFDNLRQQYDSLKSRYINMGDQLFISLSEIEIRISRKAEINNSDVYTKDNVISLSLGGNNYAKIDNWSTGITTISYNGGGEDLWGIGSLTNNVEDCLDLKLNMKVELDNKSTEEQLLMAQVLEVMVIFYLYVDYSSQDTPAFESISAISNNIDVTNTDQSDGVVVDDNPSSPNIITISAPPLIIPDFYTSSIMKFSNFNFDEITNTGNTPSTILIKGIEVKVTKNAASNTDQLYCEDLLVQLVKSDAVYQNKLINGLNEIDSINDLSDSEFGLLMQVKMVNSINVSKIMFNIRCVEVIIYYQIENRDYSYSNMVYYDNNYKFDTTLTNFGKINELIYSKVNENKNFLNNMYEKYLIFPIVDEYGYDYSSRFIFKSSWDREYYTRTKSTYTLF